MKKLCWLLLLCCLVSQAQFHLNGIVKDNLSGAPLAFASVFYAGKQSLCDVDGKFSITTSTKAPSFKVAYLGYQSLEITTNELTKFYPVCLMPETERSDRSANAHGDAALKIIREVIAKKSRNNPLQKLQSFEFKAYNKLLITANPDSIDGRIDTIEVRKAFGRKKTKIDSSDYKFKKIITKQHLFQTEKISQFQYNDKGFKETVLGSKMAGFKKPIYEILAFNLQSFSVYDRHYELFETYYKSPISKHTFNQYRFKILDTVSIQQRRTYVIHFKNKHNRKAAGLEGLLYVDTESFAIAKAVMRSKGLLDVSGTHEFEYLDSEKIWFPSHKIFKIVKGKNNYDIRVLGETIPLDADDDTRDSRKKVASDFTYLLSESYFSDIHYNQPVKIRNPFLSLEVTKEAAQKDDTFWNQYRKDTLDTRSTRTYIALDSLVMSKKIEKRIFVGRKVLNGYVPFGPVELDLRSLVSFNNYEGFRLGLGGKTSEKFSHIFRIDGYTAYGVKDGRYKYNLGAAIRIGNRSGTWIGGAYTDDVREIGSTSFAVDKRVFKIYDPRPINVSTFYGYNSWRGYFETKIIPKTESIGQLNYSRIDPKFDYLYRVNGRDYEVFNMTTAQFSLQWNPFSDYMQTEDGRLEAKKRFPRFTFQYTQTVPKWLKNDFDFGKFDFRSEYEKTFINGQKTSVLLQAGFAFGDVPLTHLYSTSPNSLTNEKVMQRFTIAGKNSFETMYFNEFFSSEYITLQGKHAFRKVRFSRKIKPVFVLVTRMAWGDMKQKAQHQFFAYKTLDQGYFESGLEINQIYSGLGIVGFYRYGPNQLPRFEDNLALKLSFVWDLGF
ncbi:carboxypeptidase-like regulatory domain-containing protein [Flavobacterium sp. CYK-4]|uniref:DUF5686 family protein n=1 Tax=Flavobacterium lotistagni TaxID=2709660 RepID=UPI00140D98C6|nr:DUF5686 family protein [Flavobacterium lotistagni]NHM05797.1 carboxypeptidase-like regulatory domain-containing protein [Flavobacterium lotistagni]